MLGRLLVRYLLQGLLLLTPLISVNGYGLLEELQLGAELQNGRYAVAFIPGSFNDKSQAQFRVSLFLTVLLFLGIAAAEITDVYLPQSRLREYQTAYFDREGKRWKKKLGNEIRLNIMYAKRSWWAGFMPRLKWAWGQGYRVHNANQHEDDGLCFFWFQGVCGKAYRTHQPVFAAFPPEAAGMGWWYCNKFWLGPIQLRKTAKVRGVLSIPILDDGWPGNRMRCVGVVNLDVRSEGAVKAMKAREDELIEYFGKLGKILASLRS